VLVCWGIVPCFGKMFRFSLLFVFYKSHGLMKLVALVLFLLLGRGLLSSWFFLACRLYLGPLLSNMFSFSVKCMEVLFITLG
jgi:hypothetical protein